MISNIAVGYDNIDIPAATQLGIAGDEYSRSAHGYHCRFRIRIADGGG